MIYLTVAIFKTWNSPNDNPNIKRQLNIISIFLLAIWFAYMLNEVAGFPYISGAILYSVLIYFSLIIVLNKGYIINLSNPKYKNTGLDADENQRILVELESLLENEKIYKDNVISLEKLSKLLHTNKHALSQVINENRHQTFFELISFYRIREAKVYFSNSTNSKISDIAFEVGYNSLSAFNAAFKKSTGLTPKNYRNAKSNP
jgi:AraC-like DNA-binding protein